MKTKILKINPEEPQKKIIEEAVNVMRRGGLVIYPTETCYGIGADATNAQSIKRVYKVKKRPRHKPISILVSDLKMIEKYGKITKEIRFLVKKFLPGPLTIITQTSKSLPGIPSRKEIGFRISSHPVASELVKKMDSPITTTSANLSGEPPIYKISDIIKKFYGKVELILDSGDLPRKKPSTIIHVKKRKILREGSLPGKTIIKELERLKRKKLD